MDRVRMLIRWVPAVVLTAAPGLATANEHVVLLDGPGLEWREARRIIEEHGGQLAHVLSPSVLVGEIPEGAAAALQDAAVAAGLALEGPSLRIVRTRTEAQSLLAGATPFDPSGPAPVGALSIEARAALRLLAPEILPVDRDPRYRLLPDGRLEVRPIEEWEGPPLVVSKRAQPTGVVSEAVGNTFYNTSDFLAGDVAVAILRPESTGAIDPSTEDWTTGEVANSLAQIVAAVDKLRDNSPQGRLTFVYRTESFGPGVAGTVSCDYEAILHPNWDDPVVLNFLGKLGYTQANAYNRTTEWVNDARTRLGTDWGFGVIVVDHSTATTPVQASAYLTGPAAWLFEKYTSPVYHHEMGHIWGAADEYCVAGYCTSPTVLVGYTQEVNANAQGNDGTGFFGGAGESIPALMINNSDYVSPWTRGQWGTWDLDGDGINDTQDTFPAVALNAPSGSSTLVFTGTAGVTPLRRETGPTSAATEDISVNRVVRVEWRMNGGPWQTATPSDGSFDQSSEAFAFTTPSLRDGAYLFEARAADHFGNATILYPQRNVSVSGSATSNNAPMPAFAVTPALGSTATTFELDATGSLDGEDGSTLQYRWDFDNNGTWDTSFSASPTASRTYASAGTKTARVEVRDSGGTTATRTASFTVSAAPVAPTATFTMNRGAGFMTAPAVFTFDASGVSDGEDPASALQVRWDFEDDGIWDTGYSTTKTASHDYAQGYAVGPSVEVAGQSLIGFGSNRWLAQSFTAVRAGIGKVELKLWSFGDNTPGGTVTVGIRSSLTGAFLTSLVRNQADLKVNDWNLYDLPDIAVTSGGTYYLVVTASDPDFGWEASWNNPYPGGAQWSSYDGGANWVTDAVFDQLFRIYASAPSTMPLTKSQAWRARMEVRDTSGLTTQTVRDFWTNAYNTPPTVSLNASPTSGTTSTTFNLTATGADANLGTTWDGLLHYRWDVDGDGNFETEFDAASTRSATFAQAGTYQATVEVRDRYHATARASRTLTVTSQAPPSVTTQAATSIGPTSAMLNASVNPNGASTTGFFQYGLTTSYGSSTPAQALGSGSSATPLVAPVSGLTCGTTYHFRAVAANSGGTTNGSNRSFTTSTCSPQADLAVTKSDGKTAAVPGTANSYTITVTNLGPSSLTSLTLIDILPPTLQTPIFTPSAGTYNSATGSWTGINLSAGQSVTLTLSASISPSATGTLTNTASVSPPAGVTDPVPGNNSATDSDTLTPRADLAATKTGPGSATPPTNVGYRIVVTNNGPSDAAAVQLTDPTPTGLSFVSNTGSCTSAFPCNLGTIGAGQSRTIDTTFNVPASYLGPDPISNTANVSASTTDPNGGNNAATATTQVVPAGPASDFFTIPPCRLLDTRNAVGPYGGPALVAGADRTFDAVAVTGACAGKLPATAKAISVNVTVTLPTAAGNLRLYPAGQAPPLISTVNYSAGQTRGNNAVVQLNGAGEFAVYCAQASGTAHAIVDVNGYFE